MAASCRLCGRELEHVFVDLGVSPLANSFLSPDDLAKPEVFYPLRVYVCSDCLLVQAEQFETSDHIFTEYAYRSSYSTSWLQHARSYVEMAVSRFGLDQNSRVLEIASNDGYLLQYIVEKDIPALGIEPAANIARDAIGRGIPTLVKFFGEETARHLAGEGFAADLIVANNVLAHVPDLNDFIRGLKLALKPQGVITVEFAYLVRLMAENQFDTIYHEHFSYFSLHTASKAFSRHGLTVYDVEELPTHGGSLRLYVRHAENLSKRVKARVGELLAREEDAGYTTLEHFLGFGERVKQTKRKLLSFLTEAKDQRKTIIGYGAPAKGNTLLNYCGVRTDFLDFTVDLSPYKAGMYLPGTRIPIYSPNRIKEARPDYVLILPWNLKDEIVEQHAYIREWGGKFVVPIPEVQVLS